MASESEQVPAREEPPASSQARLLRLTLKLIVGAVILLGVMWAFVSRLEGSKGASAERFASMRGEVSVLPKLWRAPNLGLTDQRGATVTNDALRGEPWIVDFIFTQCTSACPLMTSRMVMLQRSLAGTDVRFVSVSVDPAHDSQEALAAYAKSWSPKEERWSLLVTSEGTLPPILDGFHVTAEPSADEKNPIIHSTVFSLVDGEGWVRAIYDSNDPEALARLVKDARGLASGAAPPRRANRSASETYAELGCDGCHANARIAPSLGGLVGAERPFEDGATLRADEAYIRSSIVTPGKQVVKGFASIMPSYEGQMSDAELDALVRYIADMRSAERAPDNAGAAPVTVVVDPVCHMKVRTTPDNPHATVGGTEYFFCSEHCRDAFVKTPEAFVGGH